MKPGMKMLMLTGNRGGRMEDRNEMRDEMDGGMNYRGMDNMESRRKRDSRGRFRSEMDMEMNERYGGMEHDTARMGGYPGRPFPVFEDGRSNMNQIGFNTDRNEIRSNGRMDATHHTSNEMEYRSTPKMGGGYSSDMAMPMTRETAERWIHHMKHADGSKGPHWRIDDAKKIMEQKNIRCDPYEFAAILNAMYSDYCKVLRKHGVESDDLYVDLACAWLMDEDAMPGKAMLYYNCIVEK